MQSAASELNIRFIRAGAGAGKTTQLIKTCIDFAHQFKLQNQRYPKIVMTTFTKKATQEIKERLLLEALKHENEELFHYFNKRSMVQIGTIHGILSLYLRQYGEVLRLSTDIRVVDDSKVLTFYKKEIKSALERTSDYQKLLDNYSFKQLCELVYKGHQLYVEFPDFKPVPLELLKAEAQNKIDQVIEQIDLFLGEADKLPAKWDDYKNFVVAFKANLDQKDFKCLAEIYENKPRKTALTKKSPEIPPEIDLLIKELFEKNPINELYSEMAQEQFDLNNQIFLDLVKETFTQRQKFIQTTGEISIADLELLTYQIFLKNPDSMRQFSAQFDYFMVDEYQDTSPLQVKILNAMMENKSHFVVGDPQQSIYLFRGARSEVFFNKEKEIQDKGYQTENLMTNYRSSPRLMNFINSFFGHYSSQFQPMSPFDDVLKNNPTEDAELITTTDEYLSICRKIIKLTSENQNHENQDHEKVNFSDIVVLFKKNSDILKFAKFSDQFNIPVQVQVASGYENKREILDLVSFIRFLANPHDTENLILLLRGPWWGITDNEILQIRENSEYSFWSQLQAKKHEIVSLLKKYEKIFFESGLSESVLSFLKETVFLKASYYLDPTTQRESNIWKFVQTVLSAEGQKDFNINKFIHQELTSIQNDFTSGDGEGVPLIEANRVSLMTVHGSKGLQFKHVILPGFSSQPSLKTHEYLTFNTDNSNFSLKCFIDDLESLEMSVWSSNEITKYADRQKSENDRLLYVAMTRAQKSLTLINKVKDLGEVKSPKNSWFEKSPWALELFKDNQNFKITFSEENPEISEIAQPARPVHQQLQKLNLNTDQYIDSVESSGVTHLLSDKKPMQTNDHNDLSPADKIDRYAKDTVQAFQKAEKGTGLHRYFEALKYLSLNEVTLHLSDKDKKAIEWMLNQKEVNLTKILDVGHVEWGFGLQIGPKMIQGQIDAWSILGSEFYILDYKTGQQKYLDKAYDQLEFYAFCLKEMGLLKESHQIKLVVIYPMDEVVKIKDIKFKDLEKIKMISMETKK